MKNSLHYTHKHIYKFEELKVYDAMDDWGLGKGGLKLRW